MTIAFDNRDTDDWGRLTRSLYGEREYPPRHRAITLYHKHDSEADVIALFDPNRVGAGEQAWLTVPERITLSRAETR
jgi:hypothetical protein